jgi:hypothetical protein
VCSMTGETSRLHSLNRFCFAWWMVSNPELSRLAPGKQRNRRSAAKVCKRSNTFSKNDGLHKGMHSSRLVDQSPSQAGFQSVPKDLKGLGVARAYTIER